MDAPHVYVRAWALGCFHSLIGTRTFRRALTASVDSCAEIECPFSGVTKSGRVWRKVPESGARSVCVYFLVCVCVCVCVCVREREGGGGGGLRFHPFSTHSHSQR